jgi:hypothetical protein
MPSKVNVNGVQSRRPGVRASVTAQRSNGVLSPTGRVVLLHTFPFLKKATVTEVRTRAALLDLAPWSRELADIAKVLYEPANDPRVVGAPNAVLLVSPSTTTQAQATLLDGAGNDAVVLKAKSWGPSGNRVQVAVANNASDATLRDITFTWDGLVESFPRLGTGPVLSVYYDGAEATAVTLAASRVDGVRILQTKATIAIGTYNPDNMAWDGTITVTPSAGAASGETFTATVSGINRATGAPDTEVLTWDEAATTDPKTTTKAWSDVTSIVFAKSGATTVTFTVAAYAFDLTVDDYANLGLVADRINAKSGDGYHASKLSSRVSAVPTDEVDTLAATTIFGSGSPKSLRADLWDTLLQLERSERVEATRVTTTDADGTAPPVAYATPVYLVGGTASTPVLADWEAALAALTTKRINSMWCGSTDASVHDAIKTHLAGRVGSVGANAADAVVAAAAGETLAQVKTRSVALNTRHVALCGQKIRRRNAAGALVWFDPTYQALEVIGMQAATRVGVPQTRKVSAASDISSTWDPNLDAEELLDAGILFYEPFEGGIRVCAGVTTYRQTEHVPFMERSANASFNYGQQLVADAWDVLIGDDNAVASRSTLLALARAVLRNAVTDKYIRWFNEETLDVEELADVFRLVAGIAPVLPFNHGILELESVQDLPARAA